MNALKGCKTVHVRTFLLMFSVTFVSAAPRCYSSEHDSSVMCDDDEAVCFTVCNKNITIQGCSWGSCDALISMFPCITDCKNCKEDNCNIEACVDGKIGMYRPEKSDTQYIRVKNLTRYRLVWPDPRDSKKSSSLELAEPTVPSLSQPKIRYYTHNLFHSTQMKTSTNKLITTTSAASQTEEKPPDLPNTDSGGSPAKSGEAEAPAEGEDRQGGSGSVNGLEKILTLLLLLTLLLICLLSTCWIFLYKRFCTCNHTGLVNVSDECLVSSEDQCNLGCVTDYPCKDFDRIHIRMENVESSCLTGDSEKNGKGDRLSSCTCKRKPKVPQSTNPSEKNKEYASESRPNSKSYRRSKKTTNGIRKKKPESMELTGQTDDTSFNTCQEEAQSIKIGKAICKHSDVERVCKEINKILHSWDLTEKSCSNSSHKKIQIKNIQTVKNKEIIKKNKESAPKDGKRKHSIKARIKIYKEKNENIESFDQTDVPVSNTCKGRIQSEDKEKIEDPYTKKLQSNKKNGYHLKYGKLTQNKGDYRKNCIIVARVDNSSPENTKTLIDCSEKINSVCNDSCSFVTSNARSDSIPSESCPSTRTNNSDMAVIPCHHASSDAQQIWPNLSVVSSVRYLLVPGYYIQGLSVTALQMIMSKYQGGSYQNPESQNYQNQQGTSYQNPQGPIYQNPQGPSYQNPQGPIYQNPQGPSYQNPQGPSYQNPQGPSYQHGQGIYLVPGTRTDPSPLGSTWNKDARTHRSFVKDGKKLEVRYKHEFC